MSAPGAVLSPAATEASPREPVVAIARVEGLRLLRHPAFIVGLVASVAVQRLGVGVEDWAGQDYHESINGWAFVWVGTLLAAALVAGRERLVEDTELFPATPVRPSHRVLGTALGLMGPALATAVAVGAMAALTAADGGFLHGNGGYERRVMPHVFEWLQPVVLVILAGVVGIAIAHLRRARLAALVAAGLVTYLSTLAIWVFQAHPARVLHPLMFPAYERRLPESFVPGAREAVPHPLTVADRVTAWRETRFDTVALGWHLVYLGGLILLTLWLATRSADTGEDLARRALAMAGIALVLVGGTAQVLTAGVPS